MVGQFLSCLAIVLGSILLGNVYGNQVGLGIGLVAWALMPRLGK